MVKCGLCGKKRSRCRCKCVKCGPIDRCTCRVAPTPAKLTAAWRAVLMDPPGPETWDKAALTELAGLFERPGFVGPGAPPVPMVRPLKWYADIIDFDIAMCAAGVKVFLRPAAAGDTAFGSEWILIVELSPGLRVRQGYGELGGSRN